MPDAAGRPRRFIGAVYLFNYTPVRASVFVCVACKCHACSGGCAYVMHGIQQRSGLESGRTPGERMDTSHKHTLVQQVNPWQCFSSVFEEVSRGRLLDCGSVSPTQTHTGPRGGGLQRETGSGRRQNRWRLFTASSTARMLLGLRKSAPFFFCRALN